MSKCKPSCCSQTSSSDGITVMFGLIVLALAIYGIVRAFWHIVIEVIQITAIMLGSILAAVVLVVAAVSVARWQHARRQIADRSTVMSVDPASRPVIAASGLGKPVQDPAELFAEAVANDMDPRFVERILKTAMESRNR
jgi:hypothetical protein